MKKFFTETNLLKGEQGGKSIIPTGILGIRRGEEDQIMLDGDCLC